MWKLVRRSIEDSKKKGEKVASRTRGVIQREEFVQGLEEETVT